MTISLIVFVALQFYWLKGYYGALEQDFSNKVHAALEETSKNINEIEVEKYYAQYKNFDTEAIKNGDQPTLTMIQTVEDSASKRQITTYKNIIEKKDIPISPKGDSLKVTKMYTDEAITKFKKKDDAPAPLTSELNTSIESG